MEDNIRKKLKDFDDVFGLIDDMIRHLDALMKTVDDKSPKPGKPLTKEDKKEKPTNLPKLKL